MSILTICILSIVSVILVLTIKAKNNEIALMLSISCSVIILLAVLSKVTEIVDVVNNIIAVSQISTNYIVILLKVIGICLLTEFTVNTCKDAGSLSVANNVSLAGKIMVTVTALPLYSDIFNTVLSLLQR